MKKGNKEDLRPEYKLEDFPQGLERGRYAKQLKAASNIVVLHPEVARVFPNGQAVNDALLSLIRLAERTKKPARRPVRRTIGPQKHTRH